MPLRKLTFNTRFFIKQYDKKLPVTSIKTATPKVAHVSFGEDVDLQVKKKKYRKSPRRR